MAQITSREQLEDWLKDKPAGWARVIAARAALRVLPYSFPEDVDDRWLRPHAIALFRAVALLWITHDTPARDMFISVRYAEQHLASTGVFNHASHTIGFALASLTTTNSMSGGSILNSIAFSKSAAFGEEQVALMSNSMPWAPILEDCNQIEIDKNSALFSENRMIHRVLDKNPDFDWVGQWGSISKRLYAADPSYNVWLNWYDRRIEGEESAFDIPGDTDRIEDKTILARLADATDEDFWNKGATYVNTTLQSWINEARERVAAQASDEPPPTPEAIRAVAAEIASPSVTLTNNQLDVIANTTFDGQSDAANLDEAIAILRAVVAALLGGLPGNAPRSFAANLTIYDGELAKRDAKPFLGVLVRMEKSVSAGFHADPEMFDAGVTTNFESYFDAHLAFMTHYRRNEEREAKIAQFKIDDAAASGTALTGPVDEVAKEVAALAEQGLVTDSYAQAVKEQQEINNQIALYSSSLPTTSGEPTAKERHILQTVGFYERSLAVVNNVVSATAQFGAFVKVVKRAIAELLKFFV